MHTETKKAITMDREEGKIMTSRNNQLADITYNKQIIFPSMFLGVHSCVSIVGQIFWLIPYLYEGNTFGETGLN